MEPENPYPSRLSRGQVVSEDAALTDQHIASKTYPSQVTVWPPPPVTGEGVAQIPPILFKSNNRRVDGLLSDIQEGTLNVEPNCVRVVGKALPRREIYLPIMIASFVFLRGIGAVAAHYIMRYATPVAVDQTIPFEDIVKIVTDSRRRMAGIAYSGVTRRGKPATFSLCFRLPDSTFESFKAWATTSASPITLEGKLRSTMSVRLYIYLGFLFLLLVSGLFAYIHTR